MSNYHHHHQQQQQHSQTTRQGRQAPPSPLANKHNKKKHWQLRSIIWFLSLSCAIEVCLVLVNSDRLSLYKGNEPIVSSPSYDLLFAPFVVVGKKWGHDVVASSHQQRDTTEINYENGVSMDTHVERLISEYRSVVAESVDFQTASWFRYLGAYRVEDDEYREGKPERQEQSQLASLQSNQDEDIQEDPNHDNIVMQWDDEADIPHYFERLMEACRNHSNKRWTPEQYSQQCLLFLHGLVHKPRCTVRLDSRTVCRRRDASMMGQIPVTDILGSTHFAANTLNIVIVGAGPVGLYLANALLQLPRLRQQLQQQQQQQQQRRRRRRRQQLQQSESMPFPDIRIVVFEKRVLADGHKQPYSRRWMTGISIGRDRQDIDPRIHDVFETLLKSHSISLPINVWETLLLMSCRDLGVKFVYGNIEDYHEQLREVPNLIMFDATGHRLQPLVRQGGTPGPGETDNAATVYSWDGTREMRERVLHRWHFPAKWIQPTSATMRSQLEIALEPTKAGPLLYPVMPKTHKPYFTYRFDLNNLKYDNAALNQLHAIVPKVHQRFRERLGGETPPYQGSPVVDYNEDVSFKSSVLRHIQTTPYAGIDTTGYSIKPTRQQGAFLEALLRRHALPGETSVPWRRISPDEYLGNPILQSPNHVEELLTIATTMSRKFDDPSGKEPGVTASAYRSRPFMYKDPVIPGGYDLGVGGSSTTSTSSSASPEQQQEEPRTVPMLRVGNSLLSGDTDINSGLEVQLKQIRSLQCRLLYYYNDPTMVEEEC